MNVTAIRTPPVVGGTTIEDLLHHLSPLKEGDIVAITSKVISVCQGRFVPVGNTSEETLIKQEADLLLGDAIGRYGVYLTIKNNTLIANAGIDQSNGNGYFILWPDTPYAVAAQMWTHLRQKHSLKKIGVLITDSHTTPLRWGTRGIGLAWCGFSPLRDYIGTPDIFGRNLRMTKASVIDGLAAAAVLEMGEGNEQTPLAIIQDARVQFTYQPPTQKEIDELRIDPKDDMYAPLLTAVPWKKGTKK